LEILNHGCCDGDGDGLCDICFEEIAEQFEKGDVNGDGKLNAGDVARIYAHTRMTALLDDPEQLSRADVNGDGKINVGDTANLYDRIRSA
jgi:Ca2+-binding EF-hand superfamily protein